MADHESPKPPSRLARPVSPHRPPIADGLGGGIRTLRGIGLRNSAAPRLLTVIALGASTLGLLSVPISNYDDSLLLVGARLVGVGKTPYIDFYSHYGPLGYTILSALVRLFGHPGLALRIAEITVLAGLAILLHLLFGALKPQTPLREYAVAPLVLAFSQLAMQPAFLGFGFAVGALVLFLFARSAVRSFHALLLISAAGAVLAAAGLTRPGFAIYSAVALLVLEAVAGRPCFGALQNPLTAFAVFFGAAALATLLAGLFLYPSISPALAFNATILTPGRLMGAGGGRYLDPDFLRFPGWSVSGLAGAITTGAALFATTLAWTVDLSWRKGSWLASACVVAAGLLPIALTISTRPGVYAGFLAATLFALSAVVVFARRTSLQESDLLRASALFGLTAAAFGHYYWARADSAHILPGLVLALSGAAVPLASLRFRNRAALLLLFLFVYVSAARPLYIPAFKLLKHEALASLRPWRCTVYSDDARAAVAFADSHADPRSRFVAVGSSQAWSFGDPVELFLVSSRLPYTRWFQYDPGLQSSAAVQKEMARELEASGSQTAVVWKAEKFQFDRERHSRTIRSAFDLLFGRLYPIQAGRFGEYEVRVRAPGSSSSTGEGVAR